VGANTRFRERNGAERACFDAMGPSNDPRLDRTTPLRPGNAVAAIIMVEGAYLLQLRDNKRGIFFPAHWGCFGGAVEPGESKEQALARELHEELGAEFAPASFRYFTRFDFDIGFAGLDPIWRYFYEIELGSAALAHLRLHEGSAMRLCATDEILSGAIQLTPYDAFALWFHINRRRLIA
jgi:8-oxo-dGTP pyrophosphatase MutT (NUDIX family)